MAEYETILAEKKGDVLVVTLNRPERLNAASLQMADDLSVALYDLQGARALLITGAGRGIGAAEPIDPLVEARAFRLEADGGGIRHVVGDDIQCCLLSHQA